MVTKTGFSNTTRHLESVAADLCGGKLVSLQEGGYSFYVPYCIHQIVATLAGVEAEESLADPFTPWMDAQAGANDYYPHHKAVVDELAALFTPQ